MVKKWKRIEDGLYQRFDDDIPQNVYIDRWTVTTETGKERYLCWTWCEKVGGKLEAVGGEYWHTLKEAKKELEDVNGCVDTI